MLHCPQWDQKHPTTPFHNQWRKIMQAKDRILVALDVPTVNEALNVIEPLAPHVGGFKIGLELATAAGVPEAVRAVRACGRGRRIMLDLKLHDIPNTMAGAVRAAMRHEVDFLTIHASAGPKGLAAAVDVRGSRTQLALLGVTVLTSHDEQECAQIFGDEPEDTVFKFAGWLAEMGANGIVCSPKELTAVQNVRENLAKFRDGSLHASPDTTRRAERIDRAFHALTKVIPGIRPEWASTGDQQRVMTPGEAVRAGANYLVIGRPILKPPTDMTPVEAAQRIAEEIDAALAAA